MNQLFGFACGSVVVSLGILACGGIAQDVFSTREPTVLDEAGSSTPDAASSPDAAAKEDARPAGAKCVPANTTVELLRIAGDELSNLVEGVRRVSDGIAHDLRTPLARLKTRLERLKRSRTDEEIGEAIAEADRLLATFGAVLRIARIESGERGRAAFAEVDLTSLIDDVAELYRPLIEEKGARLSLHNAPAVSIRGDRDMLFQAVANLLDNAIKHTPDAGRIEISLAPADGGASITVEDDGPGIPAEEREKVKERFYRLDRSRSTPGSGLGLSLVSAVAARHGGELRLEDGEPGLRAILYLPGSR